ncbi:uncharacterized protein LOC120418447 [Culex pipiens pallens]|uniref:uncharacterized protein LOC120418447 n=1 Tax=Culex pipiens pallens TaxID=42434 RepID=UPI0022AA4986|nr:uncharacterized protein LOC120418447 [Culex pipiens pallens]
MCCRSVQLLTPPRKSFRTGSKLKSAFGSGKITCPGEVKGRSAPPAAILNSDRKGQYGSVQKLKTEPLLMAALEKADSGISASPEPLPHPSAPRPMRKKMLFSEKKSSAAAAGAERPLTSPGQMILPLPKALVNFDSVRNDFVGGVFSWTLG